MTAVEAALAEIDQAIADMAPAHEGLRDYAVLNLTPATLADVRAALALYDRRVALLTKAKASLEGLLAAGYPVLEIPPVEKAVHDDLLANQATITAALSKFAVNEAATLTILPGPPEPQ